MFIRRLLLFTALCMSLLAGCGGGDGNVAAVNIPAATSSYIVVAWNDLGMHCLNPSYDTAVILPPYNTVWAQVLKRGNPPQVVTSGLTVSYRIINNTTSANKGMFGQFWDNAVKLFNATTLARNFGLNLVDPLISNGLSGTMVVKGDHFQVNGIPVVPIDDNGVKNPYQVAEITVKDANGTIVAQTRATVPTSDEINCGKCHAVGGTLTQVFRDVLAKHDQLSFTNISTVASKPVLCASCHGSPALGGIGPGTSGKYLSEAIHGFHANKTTPAGAVIGCYDCHPGATTKCNRSAKHMDPFVAGECTNASCHGSMATMAAAINSGTKVPWVTEPQCVTCHAGVPQVDTGTTLYRNAIGHGGVYCTGCHGSPHAMYPVSAASQDTTGNYQPLQYQAKAMVLGDCRNCHGSSWGSGITKFTSGDGHGGGRQSACNVCHTGFQNAGNLTNWPHQSQWKSR